MKPLRLAIALTVFEWALLGLVFVGMAFAQDTLTFKPSQNPPVLTVATVTSILLRIVSEDGRCVVDVLPSGKVDLTQCPNVDEAAKVFWKALEETFPCKP